MTMEFKLFCPFLRDKAIKFLKCIKRYEREREGEREREMGGDKKNYAKRSQIATRPVSK